LGVHSVLALPLTGARGVVGAVNVYAHAENAFDDERAVELGELFALPAAVSVQNALDLAQARRHIDHLQDRLTDRAVIDQVAGILMSRTGCTGPQALARMHTLSRIGNRDVSDIAQRMLDGATRRAKARHLRGL
jgi:hypothetical protein